MLITSLYNIVDQIFIGHGTTEGLGAVGNAALVTLLFSIILVVLGLVFREPLLSLFGASTENTLYAQQYFTIILSFFPIYMLGFMLNSVIRADGSPSFAMVTTVVGAVTNIILDPIFIFAMNWGIRGAAWATVIGQILTLVLSLFYLTRTRTFRLSRASLHLSGQMLLTVAKLGISTFITQFSIVIISMVCNKMLATYGASSIYGANDPLAIIGICMKVFTIVLSIAIGIVIGAQPILGYNIGAGNTRRV